MSYGSRICEILQSTTTYREFFMKKETIIGTVVVCGLIGVVNYIVRLLCNQTESNDNNSKPEENITHTTTEDVHNQHTILERVVKLESSLSELSNKKEELTRLNEQLLHIRNTLDGLKESLKNNHS